MTAEGHALSPPFAFAIIIAIKKCLAAYRSVQFIAYMLSINYIIKISKLKMRDNGSEPIGSFICY